MINKSIERLNLIKSRLQNAFSPSHLEVIDDSEEHVGHAGSQGGAGHYTVIIYADSFNGKSRIEMHQMVYHVLHDLIPKEIHALRIKTSISE